MTDPRQKTPYDAILSHSSEDGRAVGRLHRRLEAYRPPRSVRSDRKGVRLFHYEHDQLPESSLQGELERRLDETDHVVLAASENAGQSEYVDFEIARFLDRRSGKGLHVVLLGGTRATAYPASLRDSGLDPVYLDLRFAGCGALAWWFWGRRRLDWQILPLLAALLGVEPDDLVRREARRRWMRRGVVAAVLALGLAIGGIWYSARPSAAWTATDADELEYGVHHAALITDPSSGVSVRAQTWGEELGGEAGKPVTVVMELDLDGSRTGQLGFVVDVDGEADVWALEERSREPGSLADELGSLPRIEVDEWGEPLDPQPFKVDLYRPSLLEAGTKRHGCSLPGSQQDGGSLVCDGVDAGYWRGAELEAWIETQARSLGVQDPQVSSNARIFRIDATRLLAMVFVYSPGSDGDGGILPMISDDRGENWQVGPRLFSSLEATYLTPLAVVGPDLNVLTIGASGELGSHLFRSVDGGSTWRQLSTGPGSSWLHDVVAAGNSPDVVAVSVRNPRRVSTDPDNSRVLLSSDGGAGWHELTVGLPHDGLIDLVGITGGGAVVAIVHRGGRGVEGGYSPYKRTYHRRKGRLMVWRALSARERIRGEWGLDY